MKGWRLVTSLVPKETNIPVLWALAEKQEKGKKTPLLAPNRWRQQGTLLLVMVPISILFPEALFQEKMVIISISYE